MTNPVGFHTPDNRSQVIFDVHAKGPVFLIGTNIGARAKRCLVANGVRSKECLAFEFVV